MENAIEISMQKEETESSNLKDACRLCLSTEEKRLPIFEQSPFSGSGSFAEKIKEYTSVLILATDELSTLICIVCIEKIKQWDAYKSTCLQSQKKLQDSLKENLVKTDEQNIQEDSVATVSSQNSSELGIVQGDIPKSEESNEKVTADSSITSESNTTEMSIVPEGNEKSTDKGGESGNTLALDINAADNNKQAVCMLNNEKSFEKSKHDSLTTNVEISTDLNSCEKSRELSKTVDGVTSDDLGDLNNVDIKVEPLDDDIDYDDNSDFNSESMETSQFLLNPMALNKERAMKVHSMEESTVSPSLRKRKIKRRGHTHFRGKKIFKSKCDHCQIYLHSKFSLKQHMSRIHGVSTDFPSNEAFSTRFDNREQKVEEDTNLEEKFIIDVNSEEASYVNMLKSKSLKPLQVNVISQLKTFTCYTCDKTFLNRKFTLNHIRDHLPNLRPFTCIACLEVFPDRSMYKIHCAGSFECALKIALLVPEKGEEKYFTCNMCLRTMCDRKGLLEHLSLHKQMKALKSSEDAEVKNPISVGRMESPIQKCLGPYVNGHPAYNHICSLCGMIYRYKNNMLKHRDLCATLPENIRTSYKCVHCNMTFLVYKKFCIHLSHEHKDMEITCYNCHEKFSEATYLEHHETHRKQIHTLDLEISNLDPANLDSSMKVSDNGTESFACALCSQTFATKSELSEHRNLHLKVKIYSCVICHSMFSSPSALEVHMKDHGIKDACFENDSSASSIEADSLDETYKSQASMDTSMNSTICHKCGKNFANIGNLKRHHRNIPSCNIWICHDCNIQFSEESLYTDHIKVVHPTQKSLIQCPKCPKTFSYQGNLLIHCQNVHSGQEQKPKGHSCDICGKTFRELQSLKTHRGWHYRTNHGLKSDIPSNLITSNQSESNQFEESARPAKAKKSMPKSIDSSQQLKNMQCQVCGDKFEDVLELRKHLWNVHCGNIGNNNYEENVAVEVKSEEPVFHCGVCNKNYTNKNVFLEHQKLHKVAPISTKSLHSLQSLQVKRHTCNICNKSFGNDISLKRHKASHSRLNILKNNLVRDPASNIQNNINSNQYNQKVNVFKQRAVTCAVCKLVFPNMSILYQHRQLAHNKVNTQNDKMVSNEVIPSITNEGFVRCNVCGMKFPGLANLRQHFSIKHKERTNRFQCRAPNCKQIFTTVNALKSHESLHKSTMYTCLLCTRQFFNLGFLTKHMINLHRAVYQSGVPKSTLYSEIDLRTYNVKGVTTGTTCPKCRIRYPNTRALKIHYLKFHDKP